MYSQSHTSDISSPPSLSRPRPWSPDPADPLPSLRSLGDRIPPQTNGNNRTSTIPRYRMNEPSDPSIDALDLADYAHILSPSPYPSGPIYDDYPPAPARSFTVTSHASLDPPSLVSSRGTATSRPHGLPLRHSDYRPSFPPTIPVSAHTSASLHTPSDPGLYSPKVVHPPFDAPSSYGGIANSEIDITQFPAWSRGWYLKDSSRSQKTGPRSEASRAPFFDPSYRAMGVFGNQYAAGHSASSRDVVPWSDTDAPSYGYPLDPELKEERVRMLEHEFGSNLESPVKEEPVGSVDGRGRLITEGPKKRVAIKIIEALLALEIAASLVYAALRIKPSKPPPPQSKPQTLVLYALSVLTSLFLLYHLFRPCCCPGSRKRRDPTGYTNGLAVLPVQGLLGDKKKKGKKGKQDQGGVRVNLIVDPTIFRPHQDDEESANPDEHSPSYGQTGTGRRSKRRSIFEGLAMEERWKEARKALKWMLFVDIFCLFLWSVEFIWILIREKCPPGGFNGWCNAYNLASAGTCLLAFAFGISVFFGVKDLHQSRISPRTRT